MSRDATDANTAVGVPFKRKGGSWIDRNQRLGWALKRNVFRYLHTAFNTLSDIDPPEFRLSEASAVAVNPPVRVVDAP